MRVDKERLLSALPSWQKIAVLMVALGDDLAAELMRQLDDNEATELTRALVDLKRVPKDVQDCVLIEFEEVLKGGSPPSGGIDYAHQVLMRALGVERAEAMIERAIGGEMSGFARLREIDPVIAAPLIATRASADYRPDPFSVRSGTIGFHLGALLRRSNLKLPTVSQLWGQWIRPCLKRLRTA